MTKIIRQLLDFARRSEPKRASVNLWQILIQTRDLLLPMARKQGVEFNLNGESQPHYSNVDVGQIQQVFTNLFVNAIEAMPSGGQISISIERCERHKPVEDQTPIGTYDCISVADQGQGIRQEDLEHVFEPFYTTKDVGRGTGLGLSVSFGIIEDHGGWIEVENAETQGAVFRVYIPSGTEACAEKS